MGGKTLWAMVIAAAMYGPSEASGQTTAPCDAKLPEYLRVLECRLATAIEDGLERSTSLRALVNRVGELQGIVYVSTPVSLGGHSRVVAGLSHNIVCAGETRILRVALVHEYEYRDGAIATLAHELRHVLEVLGSPETRTEADVERLYHRIGYVRARGVVETDAALSMARLVADELRASRKPRRR